LIDETPSPNHAARPADASVRALVLHYTGMRSADEARQRLCSPSAAVSAHYLIDVDGRIERLVPEERVAWHAGVSAWRQLDGLNAHSIGIELVNPGHEWGLRAYAEPQLAALIGLSQGIVQRWSIPPQNIVAHSDIAPARKADPGELFPWSRLAGEGIGLVPARRLEATDRASARLALSAIGYRFDLPGSDFEVVVRAFQRRFRQRLVDGRLDPETMGALLAVAQRYANA